jgi:CRISPR-associated protein (TIGR02584 family)
MSLPVFLATLGQRPEAITMALDVLHPRYHYDEVGILHTHAEKSGIATAYRDLVQRFEQDYDALTMHSYEIQDPNGQGLLDITDQHTAELYYRGVLDVLRRYRVQYIPVHLLVAGGRKAMSIYATLAASLLFSEHDRVWTVLADQRIMKTGVFHAPPSDYDKVQVVQLPLLPSRRLPGTMSDVDVLLQHESPRTSFLSELTPQEMVLCETLKQHPYASNDDLATILSKSAKTVERQFSFIYQKLLTHFDLSIDDRYKRQALIDVLSGRV